MVLNLRHALLAACLYGGIFAIASTTYAEATVDLDPVVVARGDDVVRLSDVDAFIAEAPADMRADLLNDPRRKEQVLIQLLNIKALEREFMASDAATAPLVKAREALALARFRASARGDQLQQEAIYDAEALAREIYAGSPSSFLAPETRAVRHVLFKVESRTPERAQQLAEEVFTRVRNGEALANIARDVSEDEGSKSAGGLIGPVPRDQLDTAFADAAFSLVNPGDLAGPVRSAFGYHVIELVKILPQRQQSFEEVESELVRRVKAQQNERVVREHIDRFNGITMQPNADVLPGLADRYIKMYAPPASDDPEGAELRATPPQADGTVTEGTSDPSSR
jgi:parvulin-like peptidyl-prolyl isomerase